MGDNNIGQQQWTLQPLTTKKAVDIATLHNIGQQPWTLQPLTTKMLWTLHQWTTTLVIAAIEERKKRERETWTLHHWTTTLDITTAVDIASMDNNIGQQPWTLQPLTTKRKLWTLHR